MSIEAVQEAVKSHKYSPVFVPGSGAYPVSLDTLGIVSVPRPSLSQALEQHFESLVEADAFHQAKTSLTAQLHRVLIARDLALQGIEEALQSARDAQSIQMKGELILAYQGSIQPNSRNLDAYDYDGNPIVVPLRDDLNAIENANRYFAKAKQAKSRFGELEVQLARIQQDHVALTAALSDLELAEDTRAVDDIKELASTRKWLQKTGEAKARIDRPYEGFAVRELLSPGGWKVLYGDNATSNDHLTTKVAKPSDLWFHVRGAPSAHVVLCTNNQPLKVQKADLEFAAQVAVRHSSSKHSGYVTVDYTQRRYVRKPRGAAPGMAVYTNEKTLHVVAS